MFVYCNKQHMKFNVMTVEIGDCLLSGRSKIKVVFLVL